MSHVVTGRYRPFPAHAQLSFGRLGISCRDFCLENQEVFFTCDFLPDRYSFSGTSFRRSPHVDFASRYFQEPNFDFRETAYYKLATKGHLPYPAYGERQAADRCEKFIELLNTFRNEEYPSLSIPPITLVECRDGNVMVVDGKHRLAALIAMGVHEFPVVMCFENEVREMFRANEERARPSQFFSKSNHMLAQIGKSLPQKQAEIDELLSYIRQSKLESWAEVYHPIPFYEFRALTTQLEPATPYTRLGMILSGYQNFQGLRVLDLGCNVGFYSFSLAKRGAIVTGIDARPEYIEIASRVAGIYGIENATFVNAPVTPELIDGAEHEWDIALCFSMIQWVADQQGIDYACRVLKTLSRRSKAMFFDVSVNSGAAAFKTARGGERCFVERFLRDETDYSYVTYLGDVHPYRRDTRHVFYCHR
jgi:2-polyprenyl-3-methyl-5-hydroxy-6-metoxy-1,4-benzoquinol methylase